MDQSTPSISSTTTNPSSSSSSSSSSPTRPSRSDQVEEHESNRVGFVPLPPPPSYAEASRNPSSSFTIYHHHPEQLLHRFEVSHRFPSGLFILRNRSSLKLLDVCGASTRVGTRLIAYNPKRPTLINGGLLHKDNNQLFFLDWHGCLCSASSGYQIDVQDHKLVLSQPTPILSQPTRLSHPPAQFKYDPITRTISIHFLYDPTFSNSTIDQINSVDYLLEVQPLSSHSSNQNHLSGFPLEKLSEWLPFTKPMTNTTTNNTQPSSSSNLNRNQSNHQQPEDDPDLDDSSDSAREVRVVSIAPGWREKFPSSASPEARKWLKRQWDIASIVVEPVIEQPIIQNSSQSSTHHSSPSPPPPPPSSSSSSFAQASSDHRSDLSPPLSSVLSELSEALGDLGQELFRAFGGSTK